MVETSSPTQGSDPEVPAAPADPVLLKRQLETLLFIAKSPLRLDQLKRLLKADKPQIRNALAELETEYQSRGIHIIHIAEGYQMATDQEFAGLVQALVLTPQKVTLTAATLETLAIVAYRQPVTKAQIEYIRGTNSDSIVNGLVEKNLVEEKGEAQVPGRPMLYGSTDLFLKEFGLPSLKDLPPSPYALSPEERKQTEIDFSPKLQEVHHET